MGKKTFIFLLLLSLISLVSSLPNDSDNAINFNYEEAVNYSLVNVNNSNLLQGLTPQQVTNLYSETDPNYFSNPNSYYNSSTFQNTFWNITGDQSSLSGTKSGDYILNTSGTIYSDIFASHTDHAVTMQYTPDGISGGNQGWIFNSNVQYSDLYATTFANLDTTGSGAVLINTPYASWDTTSELQVTGNIKINGADGVTSLFSTFDDGAGSGQVYTISGSSTYFAPQSVFNNPFGFYGLLGGYFYGGIVMGSSESQISADLGDGTAMYIAGTDGYGTAVVLGDSNYPLYLQGTGVSFPNTQISIPKLRTTGYIKFGDAGGIFTPLEDGSTIYYNSGLFKQYLGKLGVNHYEEHYIMGGAALAGSTDNAGGSVILGNPNDYATATGNGKFDVSFNIVNPNQGTGTTARNTKEVAKFTNGGLTIADTHSLGAELVTNGGFTSDTAWTKASGVVIADGVLKKTGSGTGTTYPTTPLAIVAGKTYLIEFDRITLAETLILPQTTTIGGVKLTQPASMGGTKHFYETFTAINTDNLVFNSTTSGGYWSIDNVSVKEVTGGNLNVVGNITAKYKSSDGSVGVTASGTTCTITAIKDGIITGATCI